jgi:arabinose-5-phosphate isomerase
MTSVDKMTSCRSVLGAMREALAAEANAIQTAATRLGDNVLDAVKMIASHPGKLVLIGVGKSGHIAQKLAATFCSTGTPAVFLHATEAVHGDLGVYTPGDPTILISKSGTTIELLRLVPVLAEFRSPIIAILGNLSSPLAVRADVVLDARVDREADPFNLLPTCSSTVALALGDALAVAVMQARAFTDQHFARFHPAGQLGRFLGIRVEEVMHHGESVAWISPTASVREAIIAMTSRPLGAACVVDAACQLLGLVTDGDVRRALIDNCDIALTPVAQIMTKHPVTVSPHATLQQAASLMEERSSQLSVLPVVDTHHSRCMGLIRIHDVYQPELV